MTLFTQYDCDGDLWEIMVSVPGMSATVAGPRIFRAPPHPDVQFSHATQQEADSDAEKIRKYIAQLKPTVKQKSKYMT